MSNETESSAGQLATDVAVATEAKPVPKAKSRDQKRLEYETKKKKIEDAVAAHEAQLSAQPVIVTAHGRIPQVTGHMERVACPLYPENEGSPQLYGLFQVNHAEFIVKGEIPIDESITDVPPGIQRHARRIALMCPGFEGWDFLDEAGKEPIPCPHGDDWRSYLPILDQKRGLFNLALWCIGPGYAAALQQTIKNLQTRSTPTTGSGSKSRGTRKGLN